MLRKALLLVYVARFVSLQNMEPFIVGGSPAGMQNYGYSAFVAAQILDQTFVCGSSILNQNIILTAAHCFEGFTKYSKIIVRAGSANKLKGSMRHATRIAMHPGYDTHTIENDIALAYIKKPFQFCSYVKRVSIMRNPPRVNVGYVAGWGLIDEYRQIESNYLQRAKQSLWSREECRKVLRKVPNGVLCGGARHASEYAAEGDSGSALVINDYIQIGLVSFKRPEISRSIVVYTDVSYFYNWITTTAQRLYCKG